MDTVLAIALAIFGIMVLVVLHELGHFFAARAVGMRVEKLYLFFGKPIWKVQRGETEYGVGSIPLGGYAKISGMNPEEELPPEVVPRAYYTQAVWKRCFVILAGPFVNVVVAFVILFGLAFTAEEPTALAVGAIVKASPAEGELLAGDRILAVDGLRADPDESLEQQAQALSEAVSAHECQSEPRDGCRAATPARILVERDGETLVLSLRPSYDEEIARTRLGFQFREADFQPLNPSVPEAAALSGELMWLVTSETAKTFAQLFKASERDKLGSVVGAVETTRQAIQIDVEIALRVIALVSLSLALINLMPILPLDGGHVFWSIVEKLRGRRASLRTMEQASAVGFMLILVIFAIGFTNDLGRFSNGDFDLR
ncbi:MAG: M50 family metallopeptidase [Solirubrobacterales bacterium]